MSTTQPASLAQFQSEALNDPLAQYAWNTKYRWWKSPGESDEATINDTRARVVNAVYRDDQSREARAQCLDLVRAGILIPGGRINAGAGIGSAVTELNCLSGDTQIITRELGSVALREVAGQPLTVATESGWEPAMIRAFGRQRLNRICFRPAYRHARHWRKTPGGQYRRCEYATANHRWLLIDGGVTTRLRSGQIVKSCAAAIDVAHPAYIAGFRHGVIFGDGSAQFQRHTGFTQYQLRLCGARKHDLVQAFAPIEAAGPRGGRYVATDYERCRINHDFYDNGDTLITHWSDIDLKAVPITDLANEYYAGFISGWLATDGHRVHATFELFSQNHSALAWLEQHAALGGWVVVGHRTFSDKPTNFGERSEPCRVMRLQKPQTVAWYVESIEPAQLADVYCAVVPNARAFALSSGIYTGNCYVMNTVMDSMPGIQLSIMRTALTLQQGGGTGTDFSTIRPAGALVRRTRSVASGVISFMEQQDGMSAAIASAGWRRGAMMGCLRCDHPDVWNPQQSEWTTGYDGRQILKHPSFISAKRQPGRLTQFNMSVLITADFMLAVQNDADWDLGFHAPPADNSHVDCYDVPFPYDYHEIDNELHHSDVVIAKGELRRWYVYRRVKARRIWHDIMQSNYKYAEPGVIFIDRVNERNNLRYCETISATNPCGEEPLPPGGCCCLGSINTAFLVKRPFTPDASFDFELFHHAATVGVRMLDNVLSMASYPLAEQREESYAKRRIGLGITGWADTLIQLGIRYGTAESVAVSREVARTLRDASYWASAHLAKQRGPFPLYDRSQFLDSYNVRSLPEQTRELIHAHGIRNGVLNTIAPNGTLALYTGNVGSGHEPIFTFAPMQRKIRQPDGSAKDYQSVPYAYRLWSHINGPTPREKLPDYFVGAMDISAMDHIRVHAAWQEFIDASCSKTTNVATDMSFEEFAEVYQAAYDLGCKGCTTYREDPDSGRGSVLSITKAAEPVVTPPVVMPRNEILTGRTYKIKWALTNENWYITINNNTGIPCEMFIISKNVIHQEWVTALSRTVTAILRRGGDIAFLVDELTAVHSASGGCWFKQHYCPSVVAAIGHVLAAEFALLGVIQIPADDSPTATSEQIITNRRCPQCNAPTFIREVGCDRCLSCGHNTCS